MNEGVSEYEAINGEDVRTALRKMKNGKVKRLDGTVEI